MKIDARMRRRARILAMQALYSMDVGGASARSAWEAAHALANTPGKKPRDPALDLEVTGDDGAATYGAELLSDVERLRTRIDELISGVSTEWRVERMSRLDVQILRVGAAELLIRRADVPTAVAIDEAVELAREFGGEGSPGFVNGVLDAIAREIGTGSRPGEKAE